MKRQRIMLRQLDIFKDAPESLLNQIELLRHAIHHGHTTDGFSVIEENLTHQTIADMVGAARETVTKTLLELKQEAFISYSDQGHIMLNIKKIGSECAGCLKPL